LLLVDAVDVVNQVFAVLNNMMWLLVLTLITTYISV